MDTFGQQFGGVLCRIAWKAISGHIKAECPAGKVWAAHLLVTKKQSRGVEGVVPASVDFCLPPF